MLSIIDKWNQSLLFLTMNLFDERVWVKYKICYENKDHLEQLLLNANNSQTGCIRQFNYSCSAIWRINKHHNHMKYLCLFVCFFFCFCFFFLFFFWKISVAMVIWSGTRLDPEQQSNCNFKHTKIYTCSTKYWYKKTKNNIENVQEMTQSQNIVTSGTKRKNKQTETNSIKATNQRRPKQSAPLSSTRWSQCLAW